ncbi:LLM class flavin-dependent oxidoreductase [soil metagenome]
MTDLPPLSVLDLATVTRGETPADALGHTLELAREADRLGYERFWVAEHHNMPGIASSAPAVLIAALAAETERIRVGSGGVMLPNHPPLVVAEQFGMLDALHPDRIDLGIGRAPGTDPMTATALRRSQGALSDDDFPQELGELVGFFEGRFPEGHPYGQIRAVPGAGNMPEIWLLGSSGYSAQVAGMLGWPFAFAHHFMARNTLPALKLYRESFRPSERLKRPHAMVAVAVIAAEDDDEARRLARPARLSMARLRSGNPSQFPTNAEAAETELSERDEEKLRDLEGSAIVGGPERVASRLRELAESTQADELMITVPMAEQRDRLRTLERVAGMAGRAQNLVT